MTNLKPIHTIIIVLISVFFTASCEQVRNPCFEPTINGMRFQTYQAYEGDTGIVIADSFLPSARLVVLDSNILFSQEGRNNLIGIWLSSKADSTRYTLLPDTNKPFINGYPATDTITFYYQRKLHFISQACGYTYYYNLYDIKSTTNSLDSIVINNGSVTNDVNVQHVKIYY